MFIIIGRISDKVILETSNIVPAPNINTYLNSVVNNYGGSTSDYYIYQLDENTETYKKIADRYIYNIVWNDNKIADIICTNDKITYDTSDS